MVSHPVFQRRVALLGDRAGATTARRWANLSAHDEANIPEFERVAGPVLVAAKASAVAAGAAFYSTRAGVRPTGVNPKSVPITPDTRSPFIAYWRALKEGRPPEEAIASGSARAEAIARNFTVSAARLTGAVLLSKVGREVRSWIRVPDADACPWCLDVSSDEFVTAEDADIGHDRCGCSIDPQF